MSILKYKIYNSGYKTVFKNEEKDLKDAAPEEFLVSSTLLNIFYYKRTQKNCLNVLAYIVPLFCWNVLGPSVFKFPSTNKMFNMRTITKQRGKTRT